MNSAEPLLQLEKNIQKEKNNTVKYVLLSELAGAATKEGQLDYAFQLYREALKIARKIRKDKKECDTLIHLGEVGDELHNTNLAYYNLIADELDQTDLADYFYNEALTLARKTNSFRVQSRILGKLAALSASNGNLDLAAEYYKQAVDAARIAHSRSVRAKEEQQTNKPVPIDLARVSNLSPTIRKSIEVSNQIKQTERLQTYQRYIGVVVAILLIIIFVVIAYNIFSKAVSNQAIYLVAGISFLTAIYTLKMLKHTFSSPSDDN